MMKHIHLIFVSFILTACANFNNGIGTISPDAVPEVGKILEKQTIIEREIDRSPMMYGYPYGRMQRDFYDPFFWPNATSVREDVSYQYKINLPKNQRVTLNSPYNLDVGQCVTVWHIPNSNQYPRVDKNLDCKPPAR